LDPDNFKEFKLVEKTQISHNVAKFKFGLPYPTSLLGLQLANISAAGLESLFIIIYFDSDHFLTYALFPCIAEEKTVGEEVIKSYTHTTLDSDLGYFL
jgi:cytochrome-b5 reductase